MRANLRNVVVPVLLLASSWSAAAAANPFAYDGVLTADGALANGTRTMTVTLVDDAGAPLFVGSEHQVDVVDGRFFIVVGDVDDPPLDDSIFDGNANVSPRLKIDGEH